MLPTCSRGDGAGGKPTSSLHPDPAGADAVNRGRARILGLHKHLPPTPFINESYVTEYHDALGVLKAAGVDVTDFWVDDRFLVRRSRQFRAITVGGERPQRSVDGFRSVERALLLAKMDAVVTYLAPAAQATTRAISATPSSIINVTATTVGAVSAGLGAVTNVSQVVVSEHRPKVLAALDEIERNLGDVSDSEELPVAELKELVNDGRIEIRKDHVNRMKLSAIMGGIGVAVQTTAALRPAYELLKNALAPLGISLP